LYFKLKNESSYMLDNIINILKKFDPVNPNLTVHTIRNLEEEYIPTLLKIVQENDNETGAAAAWVLGELKIVSAVPVFLEILEKQEFSIHPQIIWALSKIKDTETVPVLVKMLGGNDFDVRISSAGALGEIGDISAVEPLIDRLRDKYTRVCDFCCQALQKIGPGAADKLIKAVGDDDPKVRKYIVRALQSMPGENVYSTLESLVDDGDENVRVEVMRSVSFFSSGTDILIRGLDDKSEKVRCQSAKSLGFNMNDRAIEALGKVVRNDKDIVKIPALRSLAKAGDEKSFDHIISVLDSASPLIRMEVIHTLSHYEFKKSFPFYSVMISDDSEEVCQTVIWAMERSGGEKSMNALFQALEDKRMGVRAYAAKSLGKIGDTKALTPLLLALKDADTRTIGIINSAIKDIKILNNKKTRSIKKISY
jgi:HEAT repeat protein